MATQLLNDKTILNAKPSEKDIRLNDGGGLYLLIKPNGAKWWRFDYTIEGKRKTLSFGVYPAAGLGRCPAQSRGRTQSTDTRHRPQRHPKKIKAAQQLVIENEKRLDRGLTIINSFEHVSASMVSFNRPHRPRYYPRKENQAL